ncbi:MAG: ornithine cyclodeaminase family protein [Pseudomonadota bacterium]
MKMFDADAVHRLLPYAALVAALREHHTRDIDDVRSHLLVGPDTGHGAANFLTLPAWQHGKALGAKLVTVFPANEKTDTGLPSVQAVFVLFDGETGAPRACIDGTALTLRKTAADSALGAQFLAREDARALLMVGAGAMAPHLIAAHRAVRPSLETILIWNRTPQRAHDLAAALSGDGMDATVVDDLEAATRQADVISCATMATTPLIIGAWLAPGAHLDLVGSYRRDMVECDVAAVRDNALFVDSPWSALHDNGEVAVPLEAGQLSRSDIRADHFDFARGHHAGRASSEEITVFKNGGGGHLDLMVAQHLVDVAED